MFRRPPKGGTTCLLKRVGRARRARRCGRIGDPSLPIVFLMLSVSCLAGWPTYHGGSALTGYADVSFSEKPELVWRYSAGDAIYSTPVSDGTNLFFAVKGGRVVALDLAGQKKWERSFVRTNDAGKEMPQKFEAPLVVFDGKVLAGSARGKLYALDAALGKTVWEYDADGVLVGSPNLIGRAGSPSAPGRTDRRSVPAAVIVIDQSDGAIHALSLKTSKLLWESEGVERCDGSPSVDGERIVFGSCAAALHVFDFEGKHLLDVEVGDEAQIAGGIALNGGLAFAGTRDGRLICAEVESGKVRWSFQAGDQSFATPAVSSNAVVFASDDGLVYALRLNNEDATLVWKFDAGGIPSSPVIAGDKVAVSADGSLFLLGLKDGRKLWSKNVSDEITSPAIIDGMLVVGADDGTVSAFGTKK